MIRLLLLWQTGWEPASEGTKDKYFNGQVVTEGFREDHIVAFNLYNALREFGHLGVEIILSKSLSGERKSEAIMNRLYESGGASHQMPSEMIGGIPCLIIN